jgi:outer membrane protein
MASALRRTDQVTATTSIAPTDRHARVIAAAACAVLLACWGGASHAQPLLELYRAATTADPTAASARAQHEAALHRVDQARAAFGVTANVTLNNGHSQYVEPSNVVTPDPRTFNSRQATLQFSQPLYKPVLRPQLQQAKAQSEQARLQSEQTRFEFMLRFVESAFDMLKARDALRYLRVEQESTALQMAQAKRSFTVGTVSVTDVRDAQARADAVAAQVTAAEYDLALRHQVFLDLVGRQTPELLALGLETGALPSLDASSLPGWVSDAHIASPALLQAQWALEAARQETIKANMAHAPTLDANYSYTKTWDTGSVTSAQQRLSKQIQMGVTLNVPLFASGATLSKQRESLALQDKAQADLESARRTLAVNIRQSFSAAQSSISQARGLVTAVQSQTVAVRANQRAYQVGMKVNSEVLAAQAKLSEAQRDLSRARYDAWLAYFKLKGAAGQLDEYDLSHLDGLLKPLDTPMELSKDILQPTELPQLKLRPLGVRRPEGQGQIQ